MSACRPWVCSNYLELSVDPWKCPHLIQYIQSSAGRSLHEPRPLDITSSSLTIIKYHQISSNIIKYHQISSAQDFPATSIHGIHGGGPIRGLKAPLKRARWPAPLPSVHVPTPESGRWPLHFLRTRNRVFSTWFFHDPTAMVLGMAWNGGVLK